MSTTRQKEDVVKTEDDNKVRLVEVQSVVDFVWTPSRGAVVDNTDIAKQKIPLNL